MADARKGEGVGAIGAELPGVAPEGIPSVTAGDGVVALAAQNEVGSPVTAQLVVEPAADQAFDAGIGVALCVAGIVAGSLQGRFDAGVEVAIERERVLVRGIVGTGTA